MGRREKKFMSFGSRSFILTAAIIVILGGVVSGTAAWMYIKSDPVHNTFTYGDMKIELTETDTGLDDDGKEETNSYSLKPEEEIAKDPVVTIEAGTVDSWIFVKAEKSEEFDEYLEYEMAEGWTKLEDGVYYRQIKKSKEEQKLPVLEGNVVKVKEGVTQQMLDEMDDKDKYPTLSFTAYAVQASEVSTAKEAWKIASGK